LPAVILRIVYGLETVKRCQRSNGFRTTGGGYWAVDEPFDQLPEIDPLTREAIGWLVRLRSGEATTADAAEFRRWRSQSSEHEAALKHAIKLWNTFEKAARKSHGMGSGQGSTLVVHRGRLTTRRALLGGAIAAGTTAYLLARPPMGLWPSLRELAADYRTGKGQQLKVALNSGVSLKLGTLTSIAVQSTAVETRVELIDGEAAFTADTAPSQRLVILAGGGRITAGHADFDARCVDGVVSVTCASGKVDVERDSRKAQLMPGQQISYSDTGLGTAVPVDIEKATSWRTGVLIFSDKPLGEVVEEINRYVPGHIFITNAALRARIVNGTFHRDQLDTFVSQVEQLFRAKATILPGGVTLLS
jgi:transmembrane sensor